MDPAPAPRPPEVRKHLMTPGQPRPPQRYSTSLTSVQRWVMSSLTAEDASAEGGRSPQPA